MFQKWEQSLMETLVKKRTNNFKLPFYLEINFVLNRKS